MSAAVTSYDVTGWCETNRHDRCDGILHRATGHHWWCACACHGERAAAGASLAAPARDVERALATWRTARARLQADDPKEER